MLNWLKSYFFLITLIGCIYSLPLLAQSQQGLSPQQALEFAHKLNNKKQFQQAADLLEWALLLQPDLPGATQAYLIALEGLNDQANNENAFDEFNFSNLKKYFENWGNESSFTARLGYGDNLNRATFHEFIPLTFSNGVLFFELIEDQRSKAGSGIELEWEMIGQKLHSPNELHIYNINLLSRTTDLDSIGADYNKLELGFERVLALQNANQTHLILDFQMLDYPGHASLMSAGVEYHYKWLANNAVCSPVMGGTLQWQKNDLKYIGDSLFVGLTPGGECVSDDWLSRLSFNLGKNWVESQRAGGDRLMMGISAELAYRKSIFFKNDENHLEFNYLFSEDAEGYSELLENNAKRTMNRFSMELSYELPIDNSWFMEFEYTYFDQSSNLKLYDIQANEFWVGLKYYW